MGMPLSQSQQRLRGRKIADMTDDQLRDWIDACTRMEKWVKPAKARRSWKQSGQEAMEELERRTPAGDHSARISLARSELSQESGR